ISVSANGSQAGTGIVWALRSTLGVSVLDAYDASNVAVQLWNSASGGQGGLSFSKFCAPTIANGKVYAASFSKQLDVYGLLNAAPIYASAPVGPGGTIDAGSAAIGTQVSAALAIDNLGPARLTVFNPVLSGPASGDFSLSGIAFPSDIPPGAASR